MFLEICFNGVTSVVNSCQITYISKSFKNNDMIIFMNSGKEIHVSTSSDSECAALIQGFILALNGIDFKSIDNDNSNYIKPLKINADEALYKFMMLKEFVSDRK